LKSGVIRFIPEGETQGPAVIARVREGKFNLGELEGPIVGTHRVEITATLDGDPGLVATASDPEARDAYIRQHGPIVAGVSVPEKYNRQSILKATVREESDNLLLFRLESETVGALPPRR
jgi:hypothetical protein